MSFWRRSVLAACVPLLLGACATSVPAEPPIAATGPQYGTFGFDVAGMDPKVSAGDDFFDYANGRWVQTVEIPPDRSSVNTFTQLREIASQRTAAIIAEAGRSNEPAGSNAQRIGDYYASFMDEAAIEAAAAAPLRPELDRIAAIHSRADLARELGATLRADVDPLNSTDLYTDRLFGLWVAEDLHDTTRYLPYLMQGGLGLPDREYYLSDTQRFRELRTAYQAHVAAMLTLAGYDLADQRAGRILALELAIARAHWSGVDTTDVAKADVRWTPAQFAAKAPGLDWSAYFATAGLRGQPAIGVWQSTAITGIARLVGSEPIDTWKDYLAYHAVSRAAAFLPKAYADADFAFSGRLLNGTPEQPARWKRAVDHTNTALGDAIGRLYAERYFPPAAKAEAQAMVENIRAAFDRRIVGLDWMSPGTRAKAREKLARMRVGIGYPDNWRDYSGLEIVRGDAYGNQVRAELFEHHRNLAKLGKPVDRSEWFMWPQEVNALNAPLQNSVIFPAAILQPPFFDPLADPAVNYGAIGGIIGHEISHGFDDTGALFDAEGRLHNWWTPQDMAHFAERGRALVAQYDGYRPFADAGVSGELTLGENIADLGGVSVAYDAYQILLKGRPAPVLGGFTGDQRFFLGWAQNYRSKHREASLRRALVTDVHAPGEYRADTVRNLDAWYAAFSVKSGEKLHLAPDQRVRIW
ncbi:M13 family metallopeptidase [Phenylobacterium sp.]|uniref:M13 family metallopeptidase n=1 Tax=Phenylobacterium sp. TaxID=1871053 RepID=UPI002737707A|nr:M13 family metallopeptidase [Phenylobacterium sp.]MDP3659351.1 M13 family metallopeptidase [Phenylobacterium sp.]